MGNKLFESHQLRDIILYRRNSAVIANLLLLGIRELISVRPLKHSVRANRTGLLVRCSIARVKAINFLTTLSARTIIEISSKKSADCFISIYSLRVHCIVDPPEHLGIKRRREWCTWFILSCYSGLIGVDSASISLVVCSLVFIVSFLPGFGSLFGPIIRREGALWIELDCVDCSNDSDDWSVVHF